MAFGDEQIDRLVNGLDLVAQKRLGQLDQMMADRLSQFQEMMNGIKITNNIEIPVVKRASAVQQ